MSYDKNTWQTGDVITANKLNHIEDGIAGAGGGGILILSADENGVIDHTWQQIHDADFAVLRYERTVDGYVTMFNDVVVKTYYGVANEYYIAEGPEEVIFGCASADGYPTYNWSPDGKDGD